MNRPIDKSIFPQQQFEDFDHFAETIQGWDLDFRQLDSGSFRSDLKQVETDTLLLTKALFNRRLEQRGGIPAKGWTFAILARSSPDIVWHQQRVSDRMLMIYPPGSEVDAVSPPGFHVLTISIDGDILNGWNEIHRIDNHLNHRRKGFVYRVETSKLTAIRFTVNRLLMADNIAEPGEKALSKDVQSVILDALSEGVYKEVKLCHEKRSKMMRSLMEYIDAHLDDHITLMDLCTVTGISPRTIQRAFRERLGVTPKTYIKAQRLNHVRQDLKKQNHPRTMVADIANRWGFWHMGQFASDYYRFFKELPSQTLIQ